MVIRYRFGEERAQFPVALGDASCALLGVHLLDGGDLAMEGLVNHMAIGYGQWTLASCTFGYKQVSRYLLNYLCV